MATSKLQRKLGDMLDSRLPQYPAQENFRPPWLISQDGNWLELDFYLERLNVAFEVQGEQHTIFIPFFHKSKDGFERRKRLDREKRELCIGHGIRLIEIFSEMDAELAIRELEIGLNIIRPQKMIGDVKLTHRQYVRLSNGRRLVDTGANSIANRMQRMSKCQAKLDLHNRGKLDANPSQIVAWKTVIDNEGFEPMALLPKRKQRSQ